MRIVNGEIIPEGAPLPTAAQPATTLNVSAPPNYGEQPNQTDSSSFQSPALPGLPPTVNVLGRQVNPLYLGLGLFFFIFIFGFKFLFLLLGIYF